MENEAITQLMSYLIGPSKSIVPLNSKVTHKDN